MKPGRTCLPAIAAASLAASVVACNLLGPPKRQPPLSPAAQTAAAEQLARAFAGVCLSESDADAATRLLRASGWPAFNTVWRRPDGVFYAAPPSPAGLFVLGDRMSGTLASTQRLTCVGHYPAETAAPMVAAIARRWGPGRAGAGPYRGAEVWALRMQAGAVTPMAATDGLAPDDAAMLEASEAQAYVQVYYNPALGDVASLISVTRPVR